MADSVQLEVRDLHTSYGLSQVLFGVSFTVAPGQCIALIGGGTASARRRRCVR